MRRRWTRAASVGVASLAGAALLAGEAATSAAAIRPVPRGNQPAFASRPVPGGKPASGTRIAPGGNRPAPATPPVRGGNAPAAAPANPLSRALDSIADTPANRQLVAVNDLAAMFHSGGPNPRDEGTGQIVDGTAFGSLAALGSPTWLPYNPFALTQEVLVGQPPRQYVGLRGPIPAERTARALQDLQLSVSDVGGTRLFSLQPGNSAQLRKLDLFSRFALIRGGGSLVAGQANVPKQALIDLARGHTRSHPLASDPAVKKLLAAFPAHPVSLTVGTSLITRPLRQGLISGKAREQLQADLDFDRLPAAPTFAGVAFQSGRSGSPRVTAAAIYPDPADAKAALAVLGRFMQTGTIYDLDLPFTRLWQVTGATTKGNLAIIRLTVHRPGAVYEAAQIEGFPFFWSR